MAERFDEAPPLPREPTAMSVPEAMGNPSPTTPSQPDPSAVSESLPPPPKFPSLTDVDISSAKAAAEAQGMPQQSPVDTSLVSTSTTDTPPVQPDVQPPASVETLTESISSRPTSTVHEDIEAAIQRASVPPGTGERKVIEIEQRLWTTADQEKLDRLLAEGKTVLVPPDVDRGDLPAPRSSAYFYVPAPTSADVDAGVDTSPDTRSMADRIAVWNQVVTEDSDGSRALAAGAGAIAGGGAAAGVAAVDDATDTAPGEQIENVKEAAPVGDTTRDAATAESGTEGLEAPSETTTEKAVPTVRSNADVSQSIFGGKFLTVPVTSKKGVNGETTLIGDAADDDAVAKTTEVMLRSDASASINILDDYGLKGGHTVGCSDAVFLDGKNTLVTCGADGKVCIWDMSDRAVSKEFVPYDGEAVTMVYPMTDDDDGQSHTIMTLSQSRLMRIWTVDDRQAVMLRSTQIQSSEKDLYMSVPVISKELKIRAAAAAAAAAVRTTDAPEAPVEIGTATPETVPTPAPPAGEPAPAAAASPAPKPEEEKERKKFSFTKVLSFGRNSTRKAVAS